MNKKEKNDLVKFEKREYYKNWRKNNKDKVREHNARYWKKRVEKRQQILGK